MVGGVAAILEGAPIATLDVDIVFDLDEANVERLATALAELDARYRDPAGRLIRPTGKRLTENKVNLLETRLGLLDALHEIGNAWTFEDVRERSRALELDGFEVSVLSLASNIESKRAAGREKDHAMLPLLIRTLEVGGETS